MATTITQIEEALEATGGFITQAAKLLGVSHAAVSQRISRSTRLQKKLESVQDENLDIAEVQLLKKIKTGDLGAICFYLKCKGKHRGYVEKQQVEHKGAVTTVNMSPEEYKKARKEMLEDDDC